MSVSQWNASEKNFFDLLSTTVSVYDKYTNATGQGWIRGEIAVKNVGKVPLLEVSVLVDLDDNGNFWDGVFVNSSGKELPNKQKFDFGVLAPGEEGHALFWYSIKASIDEIRPTEEFLVTVKAIPVFLVDLKGYGFVSNTTETTTL